jgi:hypothetical protein
MRCAAALLVLLALTAVSCGPARESPIATGLHAKSAVIPVDDVTTKIAGATPKQEDVLRKILAGIGGSDFEQLEVRATDDDPASVDLVVPYQPEGDMHAQWEAWLVAHAFAARSKELGLPSVAELVPTGREAEAEILGDPPSRRPLSLETALQRAEEAAQTAELFGAKVRRIEVLEPDGIAFFVDLQVNGDEAHFVREGLPRVLENFGEAPEPVDAGDFSLLQDSSGERIWEGATASLGDSISITDWAKPALRGCYWPHASVGPPDHEPFHCDAEQPLSRIEGASPEQAALLREILGGIGRTDVEKITVLKAEKDMAGPADAVQLIFDVPLEDRVANWHIELIARAFRERSRELGLPSLAFYSGGHGGAALTDEPRTPDHELTLAEARKVAARIREAAGRHGAKVRRLELIRPRRFAFVLELQVHDPAEFLVQGYNDVVQPLDERDIRGRYDGRSIEVVDGKGEFVLGSGGWFSVRRDLESCAPVITGFDTSPPPCPAN